MYLSLCGDECDSQIRGMCGDTPVAATKDGVSTVLATLIAAQPLPGRRLLQLNPSSRKYGQRVRCSRLPPTEAMFLSCGEADNSRL